MATPNRSSLLTKAHRILKKHYKPVVPDDRPLLESLLLAACLEDARYDVAEQAYQAVAGGFFDWNEVRVSSVKELSEVMSMLPDPAAAARRLKQTLFSVFEANYAFEIESLKKQNLGAAVQKLQKYKGITPFMVSYAVQRCLGGHSVPIDSGALEVLYIVGAVTDQEKAKGQAPGLERAIPKNKGVEFGSLLHQLAAELVASPYSPNVHKILLEINPDAKSRLPKRHRPQPPKPEPPPPPPSKKQADAAAARKSAAAKKEPAKRAPAKAAAPDRKKGAATATQKRKPR